MNGVDVKPGIRIRTCQQLADAGEAEICSWWISRRRPNKLGDVLEPVTGHDNYIWKVFHDDGTQAVYSIDELEPA